MHITAISASNIRHAGPDSTSLRACHVVTGIAREIVPDCEVDILRLVDYDLKPCTGCGACFTARRCVQDDAFNALYERICRLDALFVVSAHYAPIPAKLTMLLEKMEQLAFLPRFHDENAHSPLYHKPVGIIAHGGGTEEILQGYQCVVIRTIANALSWPVEMKIVGLDEPWPYGVAFPIQQVIKSETSIFPVQVYDWEDVRRRIEPLVHKVIAAV